MYSAPQLKGKVAGLVDRDRVRLILDLEGVNFMDSAGLGVLITARAGAIEREGSLAIVCTRHPVLRILEVTGMDKVFEVFPTLPDAVAALGTGG